MSTHGVDYLIDYYALMGIERTASSDEISQAYRQKQKQYHPDKFQGLAPELLAAAERQSNLLNEAYGVLGKEDKRRSYDEQLTAWTGPLSKNGEIIVNLSDSHFSFETLLGHLGSDPEAYEQRAEELALQFSGFQRATYDYFRTLAESATGIPPALKTAYLEQLERRDLYLSLREGFLWESMGQRNHAPAPRLDYREQMRGDLELIKGHATRNVEEQVLLLTVGERALLPAPASTGEQINAERALVLYTAQVEEHFNRQAALLDPIATEREQILGTRFKLEAELVYHPNTCAYTDKLLVGIKDGENVVWVLMSFGGDNVSITEPPPNADELTRPEETTGVAEKWMSRGYTILMFQAIQGVEFYSQLNRVAELHADKIEKK